MTPEKLISAVNERDCPISGTFFVPTFVFPLCVNSVETVRPSTPWSFSENSAPTATDCSLVPNSSFLILMLFTLYSNLTFCCTPLPRVVTALALAPDDLALSVKECSGLLKLFFRRSAAADAQESPSNFMFFGGF